MEDPGESPGKKWDSLAEGISDSWNCARGWEQESGSRFFESSGGMPPLVSESDKRCSAVDSPDSRPGEKLGEGITRDTGYPRDGEVNGLRLVDGTPHHRPSRVGDASNG